MDIMQFIISVNKISLLAFIATVSFLTYEINLLLKERKRKQTPSIPKFNPSVQTQNLGEKSVVVVEPKIAPKKSSHILLVFLLFITMIVLGGISFFSVLETKKASAERNQPRIIIQEVQSKGIKIFSKDWKEIQTQDTQTIKQGDTVNLAIEIIPEVDIDRARIRVNESTWEINNITTQMNKVYNVYYKEYTIGTQESKLKIEAQLHSIKEGWLGE